MTDQSRFKTSMSLDKEISPLIYQPFPSIDFLVHRHTRESGYPEVFEFPGFRVALAIASLPGMTHKLFNEFGGHHTSLAATWEISGYPDSYGPTAARSLCKYPLGADTSSGRPGSLL